MGWRLKTPLFMTHSGARSEPPIQAVAARSVAGFGVAGPFGPRTGSSSGIFPGNSSGCGGAPGSWIGGGMLGRGFPGGSSRGGSVGEPGVVGGISGGSIGVGIASPMGECDNDAGATVFRGEIQPRKREIQPRKRNVLLLVLPAWR
jgi:hypothetical protein